MYYVGITLSILLVELIAVCAIAGAFYIYERATTN